MANRAGRVLVVDDEPRMAEGCKRVLEPAGYEVVTADSGERALELAAPGAFDLALIDLKMPGMSGLDLLRRLREMDATLVCIMVTAYATLETAVEATKHGAYDYLAKPFTPDELESAAGKALALRRLSAEAERLREEAERNLLLVADERSRTRTIIQSMADGVMVTNREQQLVLYNPTLLRLLGVKDELPALGEPPAPTLFPPELLAWMQAAAENGAATRVTRELPGGPPNLAASIAVVRDQAGEQLGAVAVLQDITELKSLQQAMADFVSLVAHELRAPLGAIAQYLDVLRSGITSDQPEKQQHILTRCRQRTASLSQLVSDLLEFSRTQALTPADRTFKELDLTEVVQEAAEFMAGEAAHRGVTVSLDLAPALPPVAADRDEIGRLLTNLMSNAIKYNREGGSVTVATVERSGYVAIEVTDTGVGIAESALPRLGEAFFRVKSRETDRVTGTGLGLSICKQIIEAHHGHLEVESKPGEGSVFRVLLPKAGSEGDPPTAGLASPGREGREARAG